MCNANTPQVASTQTGGVAPTGLDGLETAKGPPEKLIVGFDGDSVPLDGVVAASPATVKSAKTPHTTPNSKVRKGVLGINLWLKRKFFDISVLPDNESMTTSDEGTTRCGADVNVEVMISPVKGMKSRLSKP